jgi:hypothetical protein
MSNEIKENIKQQSTWIRGLYMLMYGADQSAFTDAGAEYCYLYLSDHPVPHV